MTFDEFIGVFQQFQTGSGNKKIPILILDFSIILFFQVKEINCLLSFIHL